MLFLLSRQLRTRHLNPSYKAKVRTRKTNSKTGVTGERTGMPECGGIKCNTEQELGSKGLMLAAPRLAGHIPLTLQKTPRSGDNTDNPQNQENVEMQGNVPSKRVHKGTSEA